MDSNNTGTESLTLAVHGMTCGGCENAVRRVLSLVEGVSSVTASHRDNQVALVYDAHKTDRGAITRAIEQAGYSVGD